MDMQLWSHGGYLVFYFEQTTGGSTILRAELEPKASETGGSDNFFKGFSSKDHIKPLWKLSETSFWLVNQRWDL